VNGRDLRRALRVAGGSLASAAACATVAAGLLDTGVAGVPTSPAATLVASLLVVVAVMIARRFHFEEPSVRSQRTSIWLAAARPLADVELALALVAGSYAVITVTGGGGSPLYPLIFGVVAFSVTLQGRAGAVATVVAAVVLEVAGAVRGAGATLGTAMVHLAFIAAAATLHALFLRGLIARQRVAHRQALEDEIRAQRESARDYRLISAALGADSRARRSRSEEELKLAAGAVDTLSKSIYFTLGLIKRSLGARTCILLWLDDRGEQLKIKECATDSDAITERRALGLEGALGAVVRDQAPLSLPSTRPGQVPYYETREPIGAFLGVPVMDGAHLRGVLCADREVPFDSAESAFLAGSTEQILRAIQSEQVFAAVERSKYEHERFYKASALLCEALTLEQVMETAFDAAAEIVGFDVAVMTLYDREHHRHRVASVRVAGAGGISGHEELGGLEFRPNAGLVSMVVKNRHFLPAGGELRDTQTPIFTKRVRLRGVGSLLVLPLISADEAIGTFTLLSSEKGRFGKDVREMLGVIANQVAISLENAMMYRQMEFMATTDGLTGLTNHRCFQERLSELLDRAERHGHEASILLTDVDHFKSVNDTYGHPVGDEVLRQVSKVLKNAVRKIDIPARYGGEEFAVVLDATGEEGAIEIANRIRTEVSGLEFDSDQGKFQVTMSVGVATFPADGTHKALLIERADHALYHAKQSGRNRVVSYPQFVAARQAKKAS
jgi:two-component system, cell cycle response regulator